MRRARNVLCVAFLVAFLVLGAESPLSDGTALHSRPSPSPFDVQLPTLPLDAP